MCILLGFPESARKQDFHLDGEKKQRNKWHGKGATKLNISNKEIKKFGDIFRKQTQVFTLKYSRMKDN